MVSIWLLRLWLWLYLCVGKALIIMSMEVPYNDSKTCVCEQKWEKERQCLGLHNPSCVACVMHS